MNDSALVYVTEKLQAGMEAVAQGLGITVDYVYPILVKQSYVYGVQHLVGSILLGILAYSLQRCARWLYSNNPDRCDGKEMGATFCWIGFVVATIFAIVHLCFVPGYLINPEYYAIKEILETLK